MCQSKPYSANELMREAVKRVPQFDPLRVLATYANPDNWKCINAKDEDGNPKAYWAWAGPTIVGYALAGWAKEKEHG